MFHRDFKSHSDVDFVCIGYGRICLLNGFHGSSESFRNLRKRIAFYNYVFQNDHLTFWKVFENMKLVFREEYQG